MFSSAPASATAEVNMQALLDDNGSGHLFVNNGTGGPWSWETCSPGPADCAPFTHRHQIGRKLFTAGAKPETVFRATSSTGDTGLSPVWHGRVAEVDPPSVSGLIRVNELVQGNPARWRGGWEGDFDHIQLSACATPTGKDCTSITDPKYIRGCKGWATVLEPQFAGDYLRVADRRYGAGTAFTLNAVSSPYGHPVWRARRATAVAIVGQIGPPRDAERANCDSPLLVRASISSNGTAWVRCRLGCRAVLTATRAGRSARFVHMVHANGPSKLMIPRQVLRRMKCGSCRMTVKIDGGNVTQRTVLLGKANSRRTSKTRKQ